MGNASAFRVVEIPQGSTGAFLVLTVKNNGAALNISGATTLRYCAKTMTGAAVATDVAAAFYTTGTDGKIKVQLTAALAGTVRNLLFHAEALPINSGTLVTETIILKITPTGRGV